MRLEPDRAERMALDQTRARLAELNAELAFIRLRLSQMERIAAIGSWESDLVSGESSWSDGLFELLGLRKQLFLPRDRLFLQFVHPEDRPRVERGLSRGLRGEAPYEAVFRIIRRSGEVRVVRSRGELVREAERPIRFFGIVQDITEREQASEKLRRREQEFRALAERAPDLILRIDPQLNYLYANPAAERITGVPRDSLRGQTAKRLGFSGRQLAEWESAVRSVLNTGKEIAIEFSLSTPAGEAYFEARLVPESGPAGDTEAVLAIARDVTERRQAEDALRKSESRLRLIAETIEDLFWLASPDLKRMYYVSPAYERLWKRDSASLKANPETLLAAVHPDDQARVASRLRGVNRHCEEEYRILLPDGQVRWIRDRRFPVYNHIGEVIMITGTASDITALKQAELLREETLERLAREKERAENALAELARANAMLESLTLQDPLTGVANRRYMERFIEREWRRERRHGHEVALIMTDIDFFKAYNDRYGHQAGDVCLRKVAHALSKHLRRPTDVLIRYGGEEFAALLTEVEPAEAIAFADRLRSAVEALDIPHEASSAAPRVTISVGVASVNARTRKFEQLLQLADEALYRAKTTGRNTVCAATG